MTLKTAAWKLNQLLTRYYTNEINYNRIGTSVRYSNNGLNVSIGGAAQQFDLKGKFAQDQTSVDFTKVNRTYFKVVPNVSLNYDLKKNRYLYMEYQQSIQEPSISDLQPVVDNSNPLNIVVGNPNLTPELRHNIYGGYQFFNPASFTYLFVNAQYNYYVDQIVYNKTIDANLVTTTKPMNVSGGTNYGSSIGVSYPLD